MALFVMICLDKPNSLDLRMATRPAHLAYAGTFSDVMKLGGPILDDKGDMAGSMLIMEGETEEVARAFNRDDPYTLAGLFQSVQGLPFRPTIGTL